ncbi:putative porin [Sphingomonas lycopersici]|uniref:Porin n=1 Tax=Sphingomonas lycopersici TaxID=2951807 RepID=A0AA41Z4Z9_9SPHN|nr:putative porin [Sphingomonas lycopersici]MCW6533650.1 putative porin [Sphingomonas lycopersici]
MSSTTSHVNVRRIGRTIVTALLSASALAAGPAAFAQAAPISQNATVNLINKLVEKKVLTRAEADTMIAQAEAEASQARNAAQTAQAASENAQKAVEIASPASAATGTSVRYVPQFVRDQIKEEVKGEVLADARKTGLVAPDSLPDWVRGIKLSGDFRFREEARFFDKGNALSFVNVGAINAGPPYNTDPATNPINPAIINSRRDRNYLRIRARIGLEAAIDPRLTAYIRIATGDQNNPDSTIQSLGGYFSRKNIWLDRAYIDYRPIDGAHVYLGAMANPFRASELVWDDDVNPDGGAISYEHALSPNFSIYGLGAAFVLQYANDAAPDTALADSKFPQSKDKYIFAGQLGATWKANEQISANLYAAYYDYHRVAGQLSPACSNVAAYCLTDYSRPGYSQKGNTLFAIRDITTTDPANTANPQYYGLASKFRVLSVDGAVDWHAGDDFHVNLAGHYARNLAYSASDILARGFNPQSGLSQIVNNNETCAVAPVGGVCPPGKSMFKSGGNAWLARLTVGTPLLEKRGDWNISGSYRHIDPDALLDAFTDQDFHLGGTNAAGWTLEGHYELMRHTTLGLRWLSSQEISGPPFKVDLLQADLSVHF